MRKLWTEQYRPKTLDGYVFRDEDQATQIKKWIDEKSIPHILLSGSAGLGKTTLAKILINELDIQEYDILEINASRTNGVEEIRDRIVNFVQMIPFGPFKVVLLDECLDEGTLVTVKRHQKEILLPIKDLNDKNDLVKSYNVDLQQIEWKSFTLFDKDIQETLEIELDNGEIVICTLDHKWYVEDNGEIKIVKAAELHKYDHILSA